MQLYISLLFVFIGQNLIEQNNISVPQIEPIPIAKAAKIFNSLNREIIFDYRFEDETWRRVTIAPKKYVYIWETNPKYLLSVRYYDGRRWLLYDLPTLDVSLKKMQNGTFSPQIHRNDQAFPYFFYTQDQFIQLFQGFDPEWSSIAVKSVFEKLKETQSNIMFLNAKITPDKVEPIIYQVEFNNLHKLLANEYRRWMGTTGIAEEGTPIPEILWEEIGETDKPYFHPRIVLCGCDIPKPGANFYREMMIKVLNSLPGERIIRLLEKSHTYSVCCSPIISYTAGRPIEKNRLKTKYISNNNIDILTILYDVLYYLRTSHLGAEKVESPAAEKITSYKIFSRWQYRHQVYRFRLLISIDLLLDKKGEESGIGLGADLESQKRYLSSDRWYPMDLSSVGATDIFKEIPND